MRHTYTHSHSHLTVYCTKKTIRNWSCIHFMDTKNGNKNKIYTKQIYITTKHINNVSHSLSNIIGMEMILQITERLCKFSILELFVSSFIEEWNRDEEKKTNKFLLKTKILLSEMFDKYSEFAFSRQTGSPEHADIWNIQNDIFGQNKNETHPVYTNRCAKRQLKK